MIKKFKAVGGSVGLIFDKPVLELYQIGKDTPCEITPEGDGFRIRIIRDEREKKIREDLMKRAMDDANQRFGKMFRNLAK
jgi:hypothetical protein